MSKPLSKRPSVRLIALGTASAGLYGYLGLALDASNRYRDLSTLLLLLGICFALYAVAVHLCRQAEVGGVTVFGVVLVFALAFRLLLLPAGAREPRLASVAADLAGLEVGYDTFLLYDNDLWRHLWEAHALAEGFSPYRYTPSELAESAWNEEAATSLFADERWRDVYDNVSFNNYTTVYPPLIQAVFLGLETTLGGTISRAKLLLIGLDGISILLLGLALQALGRSTAEVVVYAWNPLLIKEVAGSGHADGLLLLLLCLTLCLWSRKRYRLAMAGLGAATVAKLAPLLLVPVLMIRTGWRGLAWFAAAIAVFAAWFAPDLLHLFDGLTVYGSEWVFNSGPWVATRELMFRAGSSHPELGAHLLTKAAVAAFLVWILTRADRNDLSLIDSSGKLLALLVLLHPAVMPWYVLWALPFVCLAGGRSWLYFSAASLLSYTFYLEGATITPMLWIEYSILALALIGHRLQRGGRRLRT